MSNSEIMSEGLKALRQKLGPIGAERFVFNIKTEAPFDYTEWRRDNLFEDVSTDELMEMAVEYAKTHRPNFTERTTIL